MKYPIGGQLFEIEKEGSDFLIRSNIPTKNTGAAAQKEKRDVFNAIIGQIEAELHRLGIVHLSHDVEGQEVFTKRLTQRDATMISTKDTPDFDGDIIHTACQKVAHRLPTKAALDDFRLPRTAPTQAMAEGHLPGKNPVAGDFKNTAPDKNAGYGRGGADGRRKRPGDDGRDGGRFKHGEN